MDCKGVVFDQRYTDGFLRLVLGKDYSASPRNYTIRRRLPAHDILMSALLHGKIYLSHPFWLTLPDLRNIDPLMQDGLVAWIPDECYASAYETICRYIDSTTLYDSMSDEVTVIPLNSQGQVDKSALRHVRKYELSRELEMSDVAFDAVRHGREILYWMPALKEALYHLNSESVPVTSIFSDPQPRYVLPSTPSLQSRRATYRDNYIHNVNDEGSFRQDLAVTLSARIQAMNDTGPLLKRREIAHMKATLDKTTTACDCALGVLGATNFASSEHMPLQTHASASTGTIDYSLGSEAFQLVRVQMHQLGYPVIETIDDLRRLSEDRKLQSYRSVICEYATRMRSELESGKTQVLSQFEHDLRLATKQLSKVGLWTKVSDVAFYLSIPLSIIDIIVGLPLSNIVAIPSTGLAKIVVSNKRRKYDWLLFGAPGSVGR